MIKLYVVEKNPIYGYSIDGSQYTRFNEILPESGKKYKVTIEELIEREDFEIVNKPYKAEHVVEKNPIYGYSIDGSQYTRFNEILPGSGKQYKVTIEEIKE